MMRKIIINSNVVHHAFDFHTAFYILKFAKCLNGNTRRHTYMASSGNHSKCIHTVMFAEYIPA